MVSLLSTWSFIQVSHVGTEVQALESSSDAFPDTLAGSGSEIEHLGHELVPAWSAGITSSGVIG